MWLSLLSEIQHPSDLEQIDGGGWGGEGVL